MLRSLRHVGKNAMQERCSEQVMKVASLAFFPGLICASHANAGRISGSNSRRAQGPRQQRQRSGCPTASCAA